MNLYEHTVIARQDTSPSQLKQITDKYLNIVEKNKVKRKILQSMEKLTVL